MTNVSSMESYKPSDDSSTSIVNVVSHASRPKKHFSRDAAKANLQRDKQREAQTKLLSEMHDTMKDSKNQSEESLTMDRSQNISLHFIYITFHLHYITFAFKNRATSARNA